LSSTTNTLSVAALFVYLKSQRYQPLPAPPVAISSVPIDAALSETPLPPVPVVPTWTPAISNTA
jgi:hypothetical protein